MHALEHDLVTVVYAATTAVAAEKQGDLQWYSDHNLRARTRLRRHPDIVGCIRYALRSWQRLPVIHVGTLSLAASDEMVPWLRRRHWWRLVGASAVPRVTRIMYEGLFTSIRRCLLPHQSRAERERAIAVRVCGPVETRVASPPSDSSTFLLYGISDAWDSVRLMVHSLLF